MPPLQAWGRMDGYEWRAPHSEVSALSWMFFCFFFASLPWVNVQSYPKRESFDKASQPQLHHFCCVPALG